VKIGETNYQVVQSDRKPRYEVSRVEEEKQDYAVMILDSS